MTDPAAPARQACQTLATHVVDAMVAVFETLLDHRLYVSLTLPTPAAVCACLDVSATEQAPVHARFLVQQEPQGWSVHQVPCLEQGGEPASVSPQIRHFSDLPDAPWFARELNAFRDQVVLSQPLPPT